MPRDPVYIGIRFRGPFACRGIRSWTDSSSETGRPPGLRAGLEAMLRGFERLDVEALRLRSQTGLDQLVHASAVDVDPIGQVRRLISSLQSDEKWAVWHESPAP